MDFVRELMKNGVWASTRARAHGQTARDDLVTFDDGEDTSGTLSQHLPLI
jgi:hypothetical protein